MSEQFVSRLLSFPLFEGFTDHGARSVLASGEIEVLPQGGNLFEEGEQADVVYLVLDGAIEIFVTRDERARVLGRSGPGALVGELAVLCESPRAASARVAENATVLKWNARAFRRLLLRDAGLSRGVFRAALKVVMDKQESLIAELSKGTPGSDDA